MTITSLFFLALGVFAALFLVVLSWRSFGGVSGGQQCWLGCLLQRLGKL